MSTTNNILLSNLDINAPPPYSRINYIQSNNQLLQCNNESPILNIKSGKLPTYEEVQLEKMLNDEPLSFQSIRNSIQDECEARNPNLTYITVENGENQIITDNSLLGTDIIFITAFFISFIFNWIGFLMLTCFCNTISAKFGGKIIFPFSSRFHHLNF